MARLPPFPNSVPIWVNFRLALLLMTSQNRRSLPLSLNVAAIRLLLFFCVSLCGVSVTAVAQNADDQYFFATLAGNPGIGSDDGPGPVAHFWYPENLATDNSGSMGGNRSARVYR